jgi:3-dehydroquinate dehydratase
MDCEVHFAQDNDESKLVGFIQDAARQRDAVILNVGGFTHTSVAIADAVASVPIPTIEVHLSDINRREPWRRTSLIRSAAVKQISGRGAIGYRDAIRHLVLRAAMPYEEVRYGPHEDNILDVRGRGPRVLLVHGGFWLNPWERDSMESLAIAISGAGYTTGNVEYRRSPVWPDSAQDVEMALRYFSKSSEPLAIVGHSAGGFLALWTGSRNPVSIAIGLAPVTDLEKARNETESAAVLLDTGAPSLITPSPADLLIHGLDDRLVSPAHSTQFEDKTRVEFLPDTDHFDLLRDLPGHVDLIVDALDEAFA